MSGCVIFCLPPCFLYLFSQVRAGERHVEWGNDLTSDPSYEAAAVSEDHAMRSRVNCAVFAVFPQSAR